MFDTLRDIQALVQDSTDLRLIEAATTAARLAHVAHVRYTVAKKFARRNPAEFITASEHLATRKKELALAAAHATFVHPELGNPSDWLRVTYDRDLPRRIAAVVYADG